MRAIKTNDSIGSRALRFSGFFGFEVNRTHEPCVPTGKWHCF